MRTRFSAEVGLAMQGACLFDAGGRRFLEIPRFDRYGAGGRRGIVSLESLTTALEGLPRDWLEGAEILLRHGLLDSESLATIRLLHAFGELIGNSDMHACNLSFFLDDSMPLRVTPCYDMLPMLWAPGSQGEIVSRRFAPLPPLPMYEDEWLRARQWAEDFWQRVIGDPRISEEFRDQANDARKTLRRM